MQSLQGKDGSEICVSRDNHAVFRCCAFQNVLIACLLHTVLSHMYRIEITGSKTSGQ